MDRLALLLLFGYTVGLVYLGASLGRRLPGPYLGRVAAVPAFAAFIILAYLLGGHSGRTIAVVSQLTAGPRAMLLGIAVVVSAVAIGNLALTWCLDLPEELAVAIRRTLGGSAEPWPAVRSLMLMSVSAAAAIGVIGVIAREARPDPLGGVESAIEGLVTASYPLPGGPTDIVFVDERSGYMSVNIDFFQAGERSEILRFEFPEVDGNELILETVAADLSHSRGLALLDNTLFVTDQGPLPCGGVPMQQCIRGLDTISGEPFSLRTLRGRLIAFEVQADGSLEGPRVVLGDLPVINFEHGIQGVEVGPDGRLYVSIGGPDQLGTNPALYENIDTPNLDWVGTILSLRPDGSDVQVFARGFRNVFQLAFDEEGNLFAGENDGAGARGWKFEEVLHIKPGANYGFPWEGTFDDGDVRTDGPLVTLPTVGSAGVEWTGKAGLGPGLLLGSERRIFHVALARDSRGYFVQNKTDVTQLVTLPGGNVTALSAGPRPGQVVAGVYHSSPRLLVLDFGGATTGGMLALACTACHGPLLRGMIGQGPDLTQAGSLGGWTEQDFVNTFRTGVTPDGRSLDAQRMPWPQFSTLPDDDLAALWRHLNR